MSWLQAVGSNAAESSVVSSFDAALGITHEKGQSKLAHISLKKTARCLVAFGNFVELNRPR